jgi:hypothetical protein
MRLNNKIINFYKLFGIFIVVLILLMGLFLLFSPYFENISFNYRIIFAFLIISYGSFRLVGIILKSRQEKDENEAN